MGENAKIELYSVVRARTRESSKTSIFAMWFAVAVLFVNGNAMGATSGGPLERVQSRFAALLCIIRKSNTIEKRKLLPFFQFEFPFLFSSLTSPSPPTQAFLSACAIITLNMHSLTHPPTPPHTHTHSHTPLPPPRALPFGLVSCCVRVRALF